MFQTSLTLVSLLTALVGAQHLYYQQQPFGYYYLQHQLQPVSNNEFLYVYPPHQGTNQFALREEGGVGEAPEPPVAPPRPAWWETFLTAFRPKPPTDETPVVAPVEEATPAPAPEDASAEKPEKVEDVKLAALETLDEVPDGDNSEGDTSDDERPLVVLPDKKYVMVEQPQFYGSFEGVRHLPGRQGDTNYLFFRNAPKPFPQHPPPEYHQTYFRQRGAFLPGGHHVDISQAFQPRQPIIPSGEELSAIHGAEAEKLQQFQQPGHPAGLINVGPGYQNVYFLAPRQAVGNTDANMKVIKVETKKNTTSSSVEVIEEQAGPSVAQAKPQAIALAGPGGVAAATPIATALVGPGGLAVAAPTATAVAGQTGGGTLTGAAAAAVNKYLSGPAKKADKTDENTMDII